MLSWWHWRWLSDRTRSPRRWRNTLSRPRAFPLDPAKISSPLVGDVPGWLEAISPFRSDLERNHALIAALQAIQSGKRTTGPEDRRNARARARVEQTLSAAPYHAELWLALALLVTQSDPHIPCWLKR